MTLADISQKIEDDLRAISKVRKLIGYDSFSEKGKNKIAALYCALEYVEISETVDDFLRNVKEAEVDENIRKLIERFVKHGLKL